MPSVTILRNLANAAVVLAAALGSRIAEMPATHSLSTRGPRVSRLAEVGCVETELLRSAFLGSLCSAHNCYHALHFERVSIVQTEFTSTVSSSSPGGSSPTTGAAVLRVTTRPADIAGTLVWSHWRWHQHHCL